MTDRHTACTGKYGRHQGVDKERMEEIQSMVSYVVESKKGTRTLLALLAALAVATLGFYVAAMSSFAKPAEAAVSCNPGTYAYAPIQKDLSTGVRVIQFNAAMRCTGAVDYIGVDLQGEIRSAGGQWYRWGDTYRGTIDSDVAAVSQISRYNCGPPPYTTSVTVRTHTLSGYTENNEVENYYPQRFSVAKTFAC
jgi:hypothetical protein